MALLSGTAGSVVYGGTAGTAIEGMKSWTLDVAVGELDASSFGSTWKLTEGGVKEWSGSAEGNADDGTAMQASAWTALTTGTKVVIDPLTGQSLSREELTERLEPFRLMTGLVDEQEVPLGLYLQAAASRDIISRMLHNLKDIHAAQEDWGRLVSVLDRLIVLLPQSWVEYRDRGLANAEIGHSGHALEDLETYLANTAHPDHAHLYSDRSAISERVAELRRATS